ncbi:MAG: GNAT family N-acetyltransferase [Bacteroidales bacterium]|nr:GNAT family N-acetyltransferase [Bacteroidales bacterium]
MRIIDLSLEHEPLYFCCLEDWSEEMKEAGDHKEKWFQKMKNKGLRVKLAVDDHGVVGGMIHYLPIELSPYEGKDLYAILCIWVHGYKQGRGNFRKQGMGKALLQAAEEDVKALGAKGLVAWGLIIPVFMRASWFRRHGYKTADKEDMSRLLWKPFSTDAIPPRFIKRKKKPEKIFGKVSVTSFINGWCPAMNIVHERAKRAAEELGDGVVYQVIPTEKKETIMEWGISDALYIHHKSVRMGPPPSYKKIYRKIRKKL